MNLKDLSQKRNGMSGWAPRQIGRESHQSHRSHQIQCPIGCPGEGAEPSFSGERTELSPRGNVGGFRPRTPESPSAQLYISLLSISQAHYIAFWYYPKAAIDSGRLRKSCELLVIRGVICWQLRARGQKSAP